MERYENRQTIASLKVQIMILNSLQYKVGVLCYHLRFNFFKKQRRWIKYYIQFSCIMTRLKKRWNKEKAMDITKRYFRLKTYLQTKEFQDVMEELRDRIAKISNDTGIKQWDLKEIVKRDFDLDA